jgi:hypothetical protein
MPSSGTIAQIGIRGVGSGGDDGRGAESLAALYRACSFTGRVAVLLAQYCLGGGGERQLKNELLKSA